MAASTLPDPAKDEYISNGMLNGSCQVSSPHRCAGCAGMDMDLPRMLTCRWARLLLYDWSAHRPKLEGSGIEQIRWWRDYSMLYYY